ncbi:carboxypeptidase-like regulatory domain-containing protein [uncultured Eudoraea sp.]|uniref:carboxypeptidase-like regulatory domain-containing protein n=1 Tax=uncultured Eudoraea sp. TaxID=1035614 RepID=UPI002634BBB7|nr:carboxypeptidase-like regulatory domain-containing protein [uncultured Eudoraea sp.]
MNIRLRLVLFLLIVFNISLTSAQKPEFIYGRLLNIISKEPIPFATIRVQNYALGVISNADGGFKIPLKYQTLGDVLEVSSMGYETKIILISELISNEINIIYLKEGIIELEEAVLKARKKRPLGTKRIVRNAINAIPRNYPISSFSTLGYYRDYQLDKNKYLNLNEAILEVFDGGFDKSDLKTTKVRLYDFRENTDFERNSVARQPYNYKSGLKVIDNAYLHDFGGNEFTILRIHDAIRNYEYETYSFVNRFKYEFLSNHSFKRKQDTYLKGEYLYTIDFKKSYENYLAYGTLYISRKDFAIHKMEYSLYDRFKSMPKGKTNKHDTGKQLIFEVITEYQRVNTKMFLNYISFHNTFMLVEPPKFRTEQFLVDLKKRCFVIKLSGQPEPVSTQRITNYTIKHNGKKVPIGLIVTGDKEIEVYPRIPQEKEDAMFKEISMATSIVEGISDLLSIKVKNILDTEGNVLDRPTYGLFDQFREYFVQQVNSSGKGPADSLYMRKNIPIFKGQPLVKPDGFTDFWMNTPLKTPIN